MLAVGTYPDMDLALARDSRDEARKLLARGIGPSAKRSEAKAAKGNSFGDIAGEWMQKQKLAEVTIAKAKWIFEAFVYPSIRQRPISEVTTSEILRVHHCCSSVPANSARPNGTSSMSMRRSRSGGLRAQDENEGSTPPCHWQRAIVNWLASLFSNTDHASVVDLAYPVVRSSPVLRFRMQDPPER